MRTFTVTAERTPDGWWALDSEIGAVSQTRRLDQVEDEMREAIAHLAGIPEAEVQILVDVRLSPEQERLVEELFTARAAEESAKTRVRSASSTAANGLAASGLSRRDIGQVLGLSHQRVSQLANA